MQFFRFFPVVPFTRPDGTVIALTDITLRARIAERVAQYTSSFYDYEVGEGDRPDTVSQRLYGTVDYTWVILLVNNIMSLYDWPLSAEEFQAYIIQKYGSVSAAQSQILGYRRGDGVMMDAATNAVTAVQGIPITALDQEVADNDAKRRIRVVHTEFIGPLAQSLRTLFQ